jgi:hypothetical protein
MYMCRLAAIALVAALFCHISILRPAAADEPGYWSVASVSGSAEIKQPSGAWQPVRQGLHVDVGHKIRTGADGTVVLARQDETVTIGAGSAFEARPAANGMMTSIYQSIGTLLFKVHKRSNPHFEVRTPYLVAVVKGTTFTVNVDAAGGAVHVTEGLVEVANADGADRVFVRPGKTASVAAARGSKVQIGTMPRDAKPGDAKSNNGKQSKAPEIKRDLGAQSVDIERASKGLFADPKGPRKTQSASRGTAAGSKDNVGGNGKALG